MAGERKRPYLLKRHLEDPDHPYYVPYKAPKRNELMNEGRFPPCVWLGPYLPVWEPDQIDIFFANLATDGGRQPPVLWPPRPKPKFLLPRGMEFGRKPGGKVITDPVTGKRRYVIPERRLITRPTRRDPPDEPPCAEAAQ